MTQGHLAKYKARSEALLSRLDEFKSKYQSADPKHGDLVDLVRHIACFMSKVPLRDLVSCLTENHMQSTAKDRLFGCLSKISRFRESAAFLCSEARKSPIFARASVEKICPPDIAFHRVQHHETTLTIEDLLMRIIGDADLHRYPKHVRDQLQSGPPGKLHADVEEALKNAKIHAEIQILAHYEGSGTTGPGILRPRIIASNKDACYLCSTLIHLHGQFVVPKTHGKLYTGWRLPATADFDKLQRELNLHLEQRFQETLHKQSQLKEKPTKPSRNESTIFPLDISTSSATLAAASCLALGRHARHIASLGTIPEAAARTEFGEAQSPLAMHGDDDSTADEVEISVEGSTSSSTPAVAPASKTDSSGESDEAQSGHDDESDALSGPESESLHSPVRQGGAGVHTESSTDSMAESEAASEDHPPLSADMDSGHVEAQTDTLPTGNETSPVRNPASRPKDTGLEPIRFRRGRFRYKNEETNMEIFLDDASLGATFRLLSLEHSREVLRSKAGLVLDVLLLADGTDVPCLKKDTDGAAYFAFGPQVVMVDATAH